MSKIFSLLRQAADDLNFEAFERLLRSNYLCLNALQLNQIIFDLLDDLYCANDHSVMILKFLQCLVEYGATIPDQALLHLFDIHYMEEHRPRNKAIPYPIEYKAMHDILSLLCKRQPIALHLTDPVANDAPILLTASYAWPSSVVTSLIALGANPLTSIDKYGRNMLFYAAHNIHYGAEIIQYVYQYYPLVHVCTLMMYCMVQQTQAQSTNANIVDQEATSVCAEFSTNSR